MSGSYPASVLGSLFGSYSCADSSFCSSAIILQHRIQPEERIFMLKEEWLSLILAKLKFYEIRDKPLKHLIGKRIFLCQSKTSRVYGFARVDDSVGPLDEHKWDAMRHGHRVPGGPIYKQSYALKLSGVVRLQRSFRIRRQPGSVGIQVGPG